MANGLVTRGRAPEHSPPLAPDLSDAELLEQFTTGRDQEAFTALVRRHGPMVLGVCRRVLRDRHDAEEAFQLTFLVLVRKAPGLRQADRLAGWLYGVADRISRKARVAAARREAHERAAGPGRVAVDGSDPARQEVRDVLDEEMGTLPEKYRAPLVLCYLEGLTNEAAARRLGWAPGSMSYRLARGRELLKRRLTRRGVCLASLPFALGVTEGTAAAAEVPEPLVRATVDRALKEPAAPAPVAAGDRRPLTALAVALLLAVLGFGAVAVAAWAPDKRAPLGGVARPADSPAAPAAPAAEPSAAGPMDANPPIPRCGGN
jgi:RNA polymerase sigma factor (sigma-70 family)